MKNILVILTALILTACSTNMIKSRSFDPVEFNYATLIAADATHAVHRCAKQDAEFSAYLQKLNSETFYMAEYVSNKSDTDQVLPAALVVREITFNFLTSNNKNVKFCQHKLSNVQASARMLARGLSNADRFDACSGDVQGRFDLFEKSYAEKLISKDEFVNLSNDLLKLKTVNTAGCTLENRAKLETALDLIQKTVSFLM